MRLPAPLVPAVLIFLYLASCSSSGPNVLPVDAGDCFSPCGMRLVGPVPEAQPENFGQHRWTCEEFARAEAYSLAAFSVTVKGDPRFYDACRRLKGWELRVNAESTWESPAHVTATNPSGLLAGVTYCRTGRLWVGNRPPLETAFTHELAHVIQYCSNLEPFGSDDHAGWDRLGIFSAIEIVRDQGNRERASCFDAGNYVGPLDGGVCSK